MSLFVILGLTVGLAVTALVLFFQVKSAKVFQDLPDMAQEEEPRFVEI